MLKLRKDNHAAELAVTVSTETFVRLALLTIFFVILFFFIKKAEHAIILVFTAFFLALALNAPVYWLSRKLPGRNRGNRAIATTLSFIAVIAVLGVFIASIVPPLVRQTDKFIKE